MAVIRELGKTTPIFGVCLGHQAMGAVFGGLRPQVFDQVVAHISAYRPGSRIEIEVERAGQRRVFKVTLVPRPESWPTPSGAPIPPDD